MTKQEGEIILTHYAQPLVRLDPKNHGWSVGKGWMRARLIAVDDTHATVIPMNHKKEERVELRYCKPWYSKMNEGTNVVVGQKSEDKMVTLGELVNHKKEEPKPVIEPQLAMSFTEKKKDKRINHSMETCLEVFELYKRGKQVKDIAVILKIPLGSVGALLKRARDHKQKQREEARANRVEVVAPTTVENTKVEHVPVQSVGVATQQKTKSDLSINVAIRAILALPIDDTKKLLAIDALTI